MTPEQIDRVFGRARLKMVTGEHVEVFRETAAAGERRRYTKRFLNTAEADFAQWTEREWRILARLIGHGIACVPEVVQFDRGGPGGTQLVQTYDAGATVDQWATILPVGRAGRVLRHVFEDCAHWWALAHHCLRALSAIHELSVVHLDIKGDNVCIPVGPGDFDPDGATLSLYPRFGELALIDFAFALVSRESLTTALPIGWQTEYDYQSPRLLAALEAGRRGDLRPTRELDWRCDMYSLAAMLKRYLPEDNTSVEARVATGWSHQRASAARELILGLRDAHDRDAARERPHAELMRLTAARLEESDLAASLRAGFALARDATVTPVSPSPLTPLTRLAPSIRVIMSPRASAPVAPPVVMRKRVPAAIVAEPRRTRSLVVNVLLGLALAAGIAAMAAPWVADRWPSLAHRDDAPARVPEQVAEAPAPTPPPQETAPTPAREEAMTALPERIAPRAARPAKPAPVAPERARTAPVVAAKAPPAPVAVVKPAPARVRFYEPPPARVASAPSPPPPAQETPKEAAPAPTTEPVVTQAPPAAAAPVEPAKPAPRTVTTTQTTIFDPRAIVSFLTNLARRDERAPIEDRTTARSPERVTEPPPVAPAAVEPPAREPAPRASPPESVAPQPVDLAARARRTIAEQLPEISARAEGEVARVFAVAAVAGHPAHDRSISEAVARTWPGNFMLASSAAPGIARQLSEDARQAFMAQRDVATAFDLQLRAFGANPRDPEVAGNLAYLYLRINPPQAETARRLALLAIAQSPAAVRTARADDWTTLGIASALGGRDAEAANALYVAIALTRNLDRTCRGVFRAVEEHGNRVVPAAQSMLARLRLQGRDGESSYCAWPARVNTARGG